MKPSAALARAREEARRGNSGVAIDALRGLAAEGDTAACPSLADLLAFTGAWEEVIPNAARLVADPSAVYSSNVFDDMVRLLARAGHETGSWAEIDKLTREAAQAVGRTIDKPHLRTEYMAKLDRLAAYAKGRGATPFWRRFSDKARGREVPEHELIKLWKKPEELSLSERQRRLKDASANVFEKRPDLKDNPEELHSHLFALAEYYDCPDEALERYRAYPADMGFNAAIYVGRYLAAQGSGDQAWAIIREKLPEWIADDPAQVAPVVLLLDRDLQRIMSAERCAEVLRTPRSDFDE